MSLVFVGLLSVISFSGHLQRPVFLCAWLFLAVCWASYLEKCIRYTDFSLKLSLMPTNQFCSTVRYFVSTMSLGTRTIWDHHNTPSRLEVSWTTQMMLAVYPCEGWVTPTSSLLWSKSKREFIRVFAFGRLQAFTFILSNFEAHSKHSLVSKLVSYGSTNALRAKQLWMLGLPL